MRKKLFFGGGKSHFGEERDVLGGKELILGRKEAFLERKKTLFLGKERAISGAVAGADSRESHPDPPWDEQPRNAAGSEPSRSQNGRF